MSDDRDEVRARLRNWGAWYQAGLPKLMACCSLWDNSRKTFQPELIHLWDHVNAVDDAEVVEYAITSLAQPTSAYRWRKYASQMKMHYAEGGYKRDKVHDFNRKWHTNYSHRTYYRRLRDAERFLAGILPPPLSNISRKSAVRVESRLEAVCN